MDVDNSGKLYVIEILIVLSFISIAVYVFVLGFATYNGTKFFIIGGRWHNFYFTSFYVLTILIAASRIMWNF